MQDSARKRRLERHEHTIALEFRTRNQLSMFGFRWITRLRLKQYLGLLNTVVERFSRERVMRAMFMRWVAKGRRVQVLYYTEKIAVRRYQSSIVCKAMDAWKVMHTQ
jgi:hypothetical protein